MICTIGTPILGYQASKIANSSLSDWRILEHRLGGSCPTEADIESVYWYPRTEQQLTDVDS